MSELERADVAIVGARCAGSAAASMLARAGRSVVVIERSSFPSDTLSTHVMFPNGCAEFQRIGAWDLIRERLRPAEMRWVRMTLDNGTELRERFRPVDGIDHGVCIPRIKLDGLLAEAARGQGADVRERCTFTGAIREAGRIAGISYLDPDGNRRRLEAKLVIGADGRRSSVAAAVGAWRPYRASRNGRGLVFRYMDDPYGEGEWGETMWQWRDGDSLGFAFPNPDGRILVLFMADAAEVTEARSDPEGYWRRKLTQHPGVGERIAGAANPTKLRSTGDVVAFFRASSGPGWALAGDAGHFKDPVIGQGMRDALWMGRTLGERVAPLLDDPVALDRGLRRWEAERDAECLPAYHFANQETRPQPYSPVFAEAIRLYRGDAERAEIGDVFQRLRSPQQVLTLPRLTRALAGAVGRSRRPLPTLRAGLGEALTELRIRREITAGRFRSPEPLPGSDRPGWTWWPPPTAPAGKSAPGEREPRTAEAAAA